MPRLRRSRCDGPGLTRRRAGRGFVYVDEEGRRVTDPDVLGRIRALAIPPAWTDVWICPWPNGHIQALGVDAKGRSQYLYHDTWRRERDAKKFDHALEVARALPRLRKRWGEDLDRPELDKEKVLACACRLLDIGFFRVGGERYADENGAFGLATIRKEHARINGDEVVFEYPAKSGKERLHSVADPEVREVVAALRRRRGGSPELLAHRDPTGRWVDIRSADINHYLRDLAGIDVSAKDFRTWHATVLAAVALAVSWSAATAPTTRKRAIARAMSEVANYLGNTPAVCRGSYVDPRIVDLYLDGVTIRPALDRLGEQWEPGTLATHGPVERAVLKLLS